MADTALHFAVSNDLLDDPEALRARAEEDGYLFFKQLLPRDEVMALRRQFLEIIRDHGWTKQGTELMDGIADRDAIDREKPEEVAAYGTGVTPSAYRAVQKLELFHALAHHPNLKGVYEKLFGTEVLVHPRHIARLMIPGKRNAPTPPHQDFIHIQGTTNVWTAWFPVGECTMEMGALRAIRGSHKAGLLGVKAAEGAGGLEVWLCEQGYEWVVGDFEPGDVLTFPSLTVHKSVQNNYPDRIRLSCDYRYQPANEEVHEASLQPHGGVAPWEELYEGWERKDLQFYWKDMDLKMGEWNDDIRWQKEKIC